MTYPATAKIRNSLAVLVGLAAILAALLWLASCTTTETKAVDASGKETVTSDTSLLGFIPVSHTAPDGTTTPVKPPDGLPWWVYAASAAAYALAPRPRENLVGAAQAVKAGDIADAGKHLLALTSLTKTPVPTKEA